MDSFRDYLEIEKNKSEKTAKQHLRNARSIMEFSDGKIDRQSLRDWVRQYREKVNEDNLSEYTLANKIKSLRVFCRFLGLEKIGDKFKIPNPPKQPHPAPSDEEVREMYYAFEKENISALYLTLASSGLRIGEAWSLTEDDIDFHTGMLTPESRSQEKQTYVTFVNDEALETIRDLPNYNEGGIFGKHYKSKDWYRFKKAREKIGSSIRPKDLRVWFADKMGRLGVQDRYIDAFCGRVPQSVLSNHYTDFSPSKLQEVYEKADLKVLE